MSFTEEKLVHVNAYTRKDGTHVKEHYRGISSNAASSFAPEQNDDSLWATTTIPEERKNPLQEALDKIFKRDSGGINFNPSSNLVLQGGVSTTNFDFSNVLSALGSIAGIAVNVGLGALKTATLLNQAYWTANKTFIQKLKPQMVNEVKKLKETLKLSETVEKMHLEKLTNAKNQEEYSKLYETFIKQKELNTKNKDTIAKIEYAVEHNNFETAMDEIKNFQADNSTAQKNYPAIQMSNPMPSPYMNTSVSPDWSSVGRQEVKGAANNLLRTGLHKYPQAEMFLIDTGMLGASSLLHTHDTNELWKVSKYNFEKSGDYIAQNGYLINSTSKLTPELKSFVRGKLYSQLGIHDAKGIVFKPDSTLSQSIIHSSEFKKFLGDNIHKILGEQTVRGSVNFTGWNDTHLSLGHADIIDMYIDAQGNIHAKVIDTYDFNKNDSNIGVEWAHNLQELKMLTNFYTINILIIPPEEWINLLY